MAERLRGVRTPLPARRGGAGHRRGLARASVARPRLRRSATVERWRVSRRSGATCSRPSGSRPRIEAWRFCPRRPRMRCSRSSPRRPHGDCRSTPGCAPTGAASAPRTASGFPNAPTGRTWSRSSPSAACGSSAWTRARSRTGSRRWPRLAPRRDWSHSRSIGTPSSLSGPSADIRPTRPMRSSIGNRSRGAASGRSAGEPYDAEAAAAARPRAMLASSPTGDRGPPGRLSRATGEAGAAHVRRGHRAPGPLVDGGPRLARGGREPGRRAGRSPRHAPPGSRTPPARGATAARVDLGRGEGPPHLGLA